MNYYNDLYDINFFSTDIYSLAAGPCRIEIKKPGVPVWETWHCLEFSKTQAQQLWDILVNSDGQRCLDVCNSGASEEIIQLFSLMMCEDAYRRSDLNTFYKCSRVLTGVTNKSILLKSIKMQYAQQSLNGLIPTNCYENPLHLILNQCIRYFHLNDLINNPTEDDIKVEKPVRNEWVKLGLSFDNRDKVEEFYMTTSSYILELTAANHQVETLFNYLMVIEVLKRLGVRRLFDYGAGIGTFILLAICNGIESIYSELPSKTMDFARYRFSNLSLDIPLVTLDPQKYYLPTDVDCVVCTEVLEHIYEPELLIETIHAELPPGGVLVVSESFDYTDGFCTHLPRHKGKGGAKFITFMKQIGFRKIKTLYPIHPAIYVKF